MSDITKRLRTEPCLEHGCHEIGSEGADEIDRLRAELDAAEERNTAAYGEMAALRAELDALRKQEPVAWATREGTAFCGNDKKHSIVNRSCVIPLYAAPVPPAAVAEVPDDMAEMIRGPHNACMFKETCCRLLAATPAPVAQKVPHGLGDAIELTKAYRDELAETGETLLSNSQARRFAAALTLVLAAAQAREATP